MKIRIGHVAHTWGRRPLDEVLREMAAIGYEGAELFTRDVVGYYDNPGEFGALLSSHGLSLCSLYYEGQFLNPAQREAEVDEAVRAARFMQTLGARHMVVGSVHGGERAVVDYQVMAETLERMGEACLDHDVLVCFHPHVGSVIENREEIRHLFDIVDPERVFFCIDTGHIAKGGSDPVEITRTYIDRIRFVHLKDMQGGRFVELGRGTIDHDTIFELLRKSDYEGWMLPEIPVSDVTEPTPSASAGVSYRYLVHELGAEVIHQEGAN